MAFEGFTSDMTGSPSPGQVVLTAPASNQNNNALTGFTGFLNQTNNTVSAAAQTYGVLNNLINPPKVVQSQVPVVIQSAAPAPVAQHDNTMMYMGIAAVGLLVLMMAMK